MRARDGASHSTTFGLPASHKQSFWVDHLKELPDPDNAGQVVLVAPDGRSPEHGPEKSDGVSYDQQLCWDLFSNTIEASMALDVDAAFRKELIEKRGKLLGPRIGKWGQLQEWIEDIDGPTDYIKKALRIPVRLFMSGLF